MPVNTPSRAALRIALHAVIALALGAAISAQAAWVVLDWQPHGRDRLGWRGFLKGDRHHGCSWWGNELFILFKPGEPARVFAPPGPVSGWDKTRAAADLGRADPSLRIVTAGEGYHESYRGRLRHTSTVGCGYRAVNLFACNGLVTIENPPGTVPATLTDEERAEALRLLAANPSAQLPNDCREGGAMIVGPYGFEPKTVHHFGALALSTAQVGLAIVTPIAIALLIRGGVREWRGLVRETRRRACLCPACAYPAPAGAARCPECGRADGPRAFASELSYMPTLE